MSKKPNIILILSDDLGYETLGCYGGTSYKTPILDNLANSGALFNNAHVQPLCTPTRVQLMSGKYNFRNYIGFGLMNPDERTLRKVTIDNGGEADRVFSMLMGDEVPPRREFIEKNAIYAKIDV